MEGNGEWLIRMNGITKIFLTEEVETHALSGVHLGVRKGEYVSIAGPSGCGKSTLLSIMGLLDAPTAGEYCLHGQPGGGPLLRPEDPPAKPGNRLRLPELQPHRRSPGLRERGASSDLP